MDLSHFTIRKLVPFINGDNCQPNRNGRELVELYNEHGFKDVYDDYGLPDIKKKNGQRPSRMEYSEKRLLELSGNQRLRELLVYVVNQLENKERDVPIINQILNAENFSLTSNEGVYSIVGGVIDKTEPIVNEAHFQDIQNRILEVLDQAQVSIRLVIAWFTNETLSNKLLEKSRQGVDVEILIFNDGINRTHGVDLSQLNHKRIRGTRGGIMHDKFCVIDNQIVITGSYNWSSNAEFRNDENITIERDPRQATKYSVEFMRLNF